MCMGLSLGFLSCSIDLYFCFCASTILSYLFVYLFLIFACVVSSLLHAGFSLDAVSKGYSSCGAQASHCGGFSCCRALALATRASVVVAHRLSSCGSRALEHRLSSCGAWA